jgi:hypothetical protein
MPGGVVCWMYCGIVVIGAPADEAAKYDGDHRCPCMPGRFIVPVNSWRRSRAEAPLRLFTSRDRAMVGG